MLQAHIWLILALVSIYTLLRVHCNRWLEYKVKMYLLGLCSSLFLASTSLYYFIHVFYMVLEPFSCGQLVLLVVTVVLSVWLLVQPSDLSLCCCWWLLLVAIGVVVVVVVLGRLELLVVLIGWSILVVFCCYHCWLFSSSCLVSVTCGCLHCESGLKKHIWLTTKLSRSRWLASVLGWSVVVSHHHPLILVVFGVLAISCWPFCFWRILGRSCTHWVSACPVGFMVM